MGREGLSAAAAGDDLGLFDVEVGDADQLNLRQPGQDASMLTLVWIVVMAAPSALAWEPGAFPLRGFGMLPALFLVPAVGIDAAWSWLEPRWPRPLAG